MRLIAKIIHIEMNLLLMNCLIMFPCPFCLLHHHLQQRKQLWIIFPNFFPQVVDITITILNRISPWKIYQMVACTHTILKAILILLHINKEVLDILLHVQWISLKELSQILISSFKSIIMATCLVHEWKPSILIHVCAEI